MYMIISILTRVHANAYLAQSSHVSWARYKYSHVLLVAAALAVHAIAVRCPALNPSIFVALFGVCGVGLGPVLVRVHTHALVSAHCGRRT